MKEANVAPTFAHGDDMWLKKITNKLLTRVKTDAPFHGIWIKSVNCSFTIFKTSESFEVVSRRSQWGEVYCDNYLCYSQSPLQGWNSSKFWKQFSRFPLILHLLFLLWFKIFWTIHSKRIQIMWTHSENVWFKVEPALLSWDHYWWTQV